MRRRTPTEVAVLCGGGPADGERHPIADGTRTIVVPEATARGASGRAHAYERDADGRFAYVGPVAIEDEPEMPAPTHPDGRAMGLAVLGHDRGPGPLAVVTVLIALAAVMMLFNAYT